ncbi:MAG: tetratricopeptide repeat protein [Sporichthyaceae bacterium]
MSDAPADAAASQARVLIDLNRPAEAVALLHRALADSPEDGMLWGQLSRAHFGLQEWALALGAADRAGFYGTVEESWPLRMRSHALQKLGRYEEAVAAARSAVELGPHTSPNHVRLADALLKRPQYALAEGGRGPRSARRRAEAILAVAQRGVELAPTDPDALITLGFALSKAGRWREGRAVADEALAHAPLESEVHADRAALLFRRGRVFHAHRGLGEAAALDPSDADRVETFRYLCKAGVWCGLIAAIAVQVLLTEAVEALARREVLTCLQQQTLAVVALGVLATIPAIGYARLTPGGRAGARAILRADLALQLRCGALAVLPFVFGPCASETDGLDLLRVAVIVGFFAPKRLLLLTRGTVEPGPSSDRGGAFRRRLPAILVLLVLAGVSVLLRSVLLEVAMLSLLVMIPALIWPLRVRSWASRAGH